MIIEVGNTYRGNNGAFWTIKDGRYYDVARDFKFTGISDESVRYFDKDGRTGTDLRLICKYEPTIEVPPEVWHGCVGAWNGNFTNIPTNLVWEWKVPDKIGLWICDEGNKNTTPTVEGANIHTIHSIVGWNYLQAWRCYLGPIPQIAQPKKTVKQTLWMVKYHGGSWEQLWLPDEEVPKFWSYQDEGHKTCTTRTV